MPNGRFWPLTKISRSCAPPVCPGSRITMISPDPMSARKMSPFGAIVSHRGRWKFFANIFTRNPCGTVGKNPGGGVRFSGPLPADFVANGAGIFGFWPCVTCAGAIDGTKHVKAKARIFRARIAIPFPWTIFVLLSYNASDAWPVPNDSFPKRILAIQQGAPEWRQIPPRLSV